MTILEKTKAWVNKRVFEVAHKQSPSMRALQDYLDLHTLGEIIPYRLYDEMNDIYLNDGTQGLVFEAAPLVGATEQTINLLTNIINHQLPEGACIHFLLYASPKITYHLEAWSAYRAQRGEQYRQLAKERTQFLAKGARGSLFKGSDYPLRNFRLIISITLEEKSSLTDTISLKDSVIRAFKSLNIAAESFPPAKLIQLVGELCCPDLTGTTRKIAWRKNDFLHRQCAFHETSLQVTPQGLLINEGESEIRLYSVAKFPESWPQWAMQSLIGDLFLETQRLGCPFFLSLSVTIPNQATENSQAAMKSMRANRILNSPAVKYVPEATRIAKERQSVIALLNKNGRLVKLTFQVGLMSEPKRIVKDESVLESLFISQGWHLYRHRYVHLPMLYACLPMVQDKSLMMSLKRLGVVHTLPSGVVANIAPLQGELKGMPVPRLMLTGRRGQLFWFDPFANDSGNYNVCVTGKSGSGKSVFMQELATSIVGSGGRLWVIDVGRSYEKTCKLLGGEFVEFSLDKAICLNPFTHIQDLDEDKMALLKPIVEQMVAPNDPISDIDRVLIEEAIQKSWEKDKQQNSITALAAWLLNHPDARANDLGKRLYPYTEKGMYGRYFNGQANIAFDNPFLVMELEELKNKGDMQSIVLMLIIFQITNAIYSGDRKTKNACIIDEAWQLLNGDKIKVFIEKMARTARKYNASIITGTQSIQDYFENVAAQAVYNNSDYTIIMMQKEGVIEKLLKEEKISLEPHMERLIKSLRMSQGEYADIFIRAPNWYTVAQLILDDFTLALYSTKGEEFAAVQELQQQGVSLIDAIRKVAKEKFHDR